MQVIIAYVFVVIIWATTPLAVQWSNSSLSFVLAVSLRMLVALVICGALMVVTRKPLVSDRKDWLAFLAGAVGLYPNMILVYWSAQFIPSGMMAVILGIYPFAVGIFSLIFLRENIFNISRIFAVVVAITGLGIIHVEQVNVAGSAVYGIVGMTISAFMFGLSSVWLKAVGSQIDPLRQSTGVLVLAVPAFLITWFLVDGEIPEVIDQRSVMGVGYLSIAGTVLGHTLFFYVLKHCSMPVVSLITLITPLMAITIGYLFANETVTPTALIGSMLVIGSLLIYQGFLGKIACVYFALIDFIRINIRQYKRGQRLRVLQVRRMKTHLMVLLSRQC